MLSWEERLWEISEEEPEPSVSHSLPPATMQRLAFVRYLFTLGIEESRKPEPLSSVALLMLHDSIELFLQIGMEHLNASGPNDPKFLDYWDLLKSKLGGQELAHKEAMRRLNKARVSLKHHGLHPSSLDMEAHRAASANFLEDNTPLVFGIPFSAISLANLIQDRRVRIAVKEAEAFQQAGDLMASLGKLGLAFQLLARNHPGLVARSSFRASFPSYNDPFHVRRLAESVYRLSSMVEPLVETVRILALGIDYQRYDKFRRIVPGVSIMASGKHYRTTWSSRKSDPTWEDWHYCYHFVIETAVQLQRNA